MPRILIKSGQASSLPRVESFIARNGMSGNYFTAAMSAFTEFGRGTIGRNAIFSAEAA